MKLRTIIITGAILSIAAGFLIGKTVVADSPAPGSSSDPVVSKSYVDKALQTRISELEKSVAELSVQAQALQNTINELQARIDKTPVKGTETGGSTSSGTNSGSQQETSSPVGKTAYVKAGSTTVNVRSTPSTEASIVQKVNKDEPMVIQQVKDSWYQVKLSNGTIGWVANWVVDVR